MGEDEWIIDTCCTCIHAPHAITHIRLFAAGVRHGKVLVRAVASIELLLRRREFGGGGACGMVWLWLVRTTGAARQAE